MDKLIIHPSWEGLASFVRHLPTSFSDEGKVLRDARNKVRLMSMDGVNLVVKQYKLPLFHQRLDYTFIRPSKAKRAYLFAERLLALGFQTPAPIACLEVYRGGLFYQGYFVSAYCNKPDLSFLRTNSENQEALLDAFAAYLVQLHERGFLHGDCNLSNFMYDFSDGRYTFSTIDINRSRFVEHPSQEKCLKNLMRLTHDRVLLEKIVSRYAACRNWDAVTCLSQVTKYLDEFEKRNQRKKLLLGRK